MKKIILFLLIIIFMGCSKENTLKEDYESLNNKYLKVTIEENKIEKIDYAKFDEINKNIGALYFCRPTSNYCRNNIEVFIELINDLGLDNIYYIDLSNNDDYYKEFINKYNNNLELKNGDIIIFGESKIIDKLTREIEVEPEEKLSSEEKRLEYKRLYDFLVQLNDPDICEKDSQGC